MDKQCSWIRPRRKNRLRITAVMLSFCLLLTTCPDILEMSSVYASELGGDGYGEETGECGGAAQDSTEDEEDTDVEENDVTVQENGEETGECGGAVQALLEQIGALPESEEYMAGEPDIDNGEEEGDAYEKAYEEWMEGLFVHTEEALTIWEAYEALTQEQQAQIPKEMLHKLVAWMEIAEQFDGSRKVMPAARSGTLSNGLKWSLSDEGKLTIWGNGEMPSWDLSGSNIPPWIKQTEIEIERVVIAEGVTTIGKGAFYQALELTSVTIPVSVTSIGESAFARCSKLTSVEIPQGVTTIEEYAFYVCSSLESVEIPSSVTSIGANAFRNCSSLKSVSIPGNVEEIGNNAFSLCESLTSAIINEGVKSIGFEAFGGCINLRSVEIPSSMTRIDEFAFNDCTSLTSVTIPEAVTTIEKGTFSYCTSLTSVTIPDSMTSIGMYAFNKCTSLTSVTIPDSVTSIGMYAFSDCADLGEVTFKRRTAPKLDASVFDGTHDKLTIHIPCGTRSVYESGAGWDGYSDRIVEAPHSCTYTASDVVITENCNNDGCNHSATAALSLKSDADLTYTGSAIQPGTVIYDDSWAGTVKPDESAISYTDNTNVGQATAELTISGAVATLNFTIAAKPLTDDMVTVASGPHYYTGNDITPAVTVKDGGSTLTEDTDYTVSYKDNGNPGTGTVTIAGKGNYTGTINQTFTIEYSLIPDGKSLTDYITITPEPSDDWYNSDITLTPKDGCSVGITPEVVGSTVTFTEETGEDGVTQTIYIKDSDGSIYQTEFPYKLDKTSPVIDLTNMTVTNGTKSLWNWIVGKQSMVIKIPAADISDSLSGIAEVTYTAVPDSGTQQTVTISEKDGYYEIALNTEFSGIIRLTAKDNAGNATQVSLVTENGKVIAEDYAPVVKVTLPDTPIPNVNEWYNTSFHINVSVTDNKSESDTDVLSGGIAEITWKDGENGTEQTVSGLPGTAPVYEKEFTIAAAEGAHTYYIKAVDNAGNESGWQAVTVRLDTAAPAFDGNLSVTNHTQEGADIAFTSSEDGKVYWLVDAETTPDAQEVADKGTKNGNGKVITGGTQETFTVGGLQPGTTYIVYVVLEDAAGNLSEVKEVSFTTLQAAPEITLNDLAIDHEKETVKLPEGLGDVEVYTDPSDPAGTQIPLNEDGSLPIVPGNPIYIRYSEKTGDDGTTPASDSAKIDIPDRPILSENR